MKAVLLFSALLAVTLADGIENCKCPEGYTAIQDKDGPICAGNLVNAFRPCNIPQRPKCKCTGATAVLSEGDSTFCINSEIGKETKKWSCENKEEWEKFNQEHKN